MKGRAEKAIQRNCEITKTNRKQAKGIHTTSVQTDITESTSNLDITTGKKSGKHQCGKRLCRVQNVDYVTMTHEDMRQGDCSY